MKWVNWYISPRIFSQTTCYPSSPWVHRAYACKRCKTCFLSLTWHFFRRHPASPQVIKFMRRSPVKITQSSMTGLFLCLFKFRIIFHSSRRPQVWSERVKRGIWYPRGAAKGRGHPDFFTLGDFHGSRQLQGCILTRLGPVRIDCQADEEIGCRQIMALHERWGCSEHTVVGGQSDFGSALMMIRYAMYAWFTLISSPHGHRKSFWSEGR